MSLPRLSRPALSLVPSLRSLYIYFYLSLGICVYALRETIERELTLGKLGCRTTRTSPICDFAIPMAATRPLAKYADPPPKPQRGDTSGAGREVRER